MESVRNGLFAMGSITNRVDGHQVGSDAGEAVFRQVHLPEHGVNLYCGMVGLPCSQVLDRECNRERRDSFQNYHRIGTGEIPGHEIVVDTVSQAIGGLEGRRWPHENILLKQEPALGGDYMVAVFGQRVRCVADLFDLVIHSARLFCVELEPRVRLDTVECRLVEEFDSTRAIVSGNVVHDLERRTTRKVEVDVAEGSFANGRQDMRTVDRIVFGFRVLR